MELQYFINALSKNKNTIQSLVSGIPVEQARWKPTPQRWSLLEVINHLYDEEREDFRMRLDLTLHHPGKAAPPFDNEKWVVEREYNAKDPEESVERFVKERENSLAWLAGLGDVNWNATFEHPKLVLRAGDLITSWLSHDYLHMRQLSRLHYDYTQQRAKPYDSRYAGDAGAW
jgi:hypothetical protein